MGGDAETLLPGGGAFQKAGKDPPPSDVSPGMDPASQFAPAAAPGLLPPCERTGMEVLADGTIIRIEPLRRGDRAGVGRLFAQLGAESRLRRFLSPKATLSDGELTFLADVGRAGHSAMAAIDVRDGSVIGIARYGGHQDQPRAADTAVAVADAFQRRGVGTALMLALVDCARANGFERLTATTFWENRPARALVKRVGFRACGSSGSEIELALDLAAPHRAEDPAS